MALPSNKIKKVKLPNNAEYEIIPERLQNSNYAAELPTLTNDATIITNLNLKTINNTSLVGTGNIDITTGSSDYNDLLNIPIVNQDLTNASFTPVANTYYRHTGNTSAGLSAFEIGDTLELGDKIHINTNKLSEFETFIGNISAAAKQNGVILAGHDIASFTDTTKCPLLLFREDTVDLLLVGGSLDNLESNTLYSSADLSQYNLNISAGWNNLDENGDFTITNNVSQVNTAVPCTINGLYTIDSSWNGNIISIVGHGESLVNGQIYLYDGTNYINIIDSPIIKQDLAATGFVPVNGKYYLHTGDTIDSIPLAIGDTPEYFYFNTNMSESDINALLVANKNSITYIMNDGDTHLAYLAHNKANPSSSLSDDDKFLAYYRIDYPTSASVVTDSSTDDLYLLGYYDPNNGIIPVYSTAPTIREVGGAAKGWNTTNLPMPWSDTINYLQGSSFINSFISEEPFGTGIEHNTIYHYKNNQYVAIDNEQISTASWGNISGNISDQTDLTTALSNKMDKANPTGAGSLSLNRQANTSIGTNSAAVGSNTTASGISSFAEGDNTSASGSYSHAEGLRTNASGGSSHAEGTSTNASGYASHAEGRITSASGQYSHAEGYNTVASNTAAHAEGEFTNASGRDSHAEGSGVTASGISSHAEGDSTNAFNDYSHAEGWFTNASGEASHAEGNNSSANNSSAHAEGDSTTASGGASHAEGDSTYAIGACSHAEGSGTIAYADGSHAEGDQTQANGSASHAEGVTTIASGDASHAEGISTEASGYASHVEGIGTIANHASQHVFGEYNIEDPNTAGSEDRGTYVEIVGNGNDSVSSNARTLDWSGNEWLAGNLTIGANAVLSDGTNSIAIANIANSSHAHGNILTSGTITSTAVSAATGVLVYDSSNKIQRATAANTRTIIGAGTYSKPSDGIPDSDIANASTWNSIPIVSLTTTAGSQKIQVDSTSLDIIQRTAGNTPTNGAIYSTTSTASTPSQCLSNGFYYVSSSTQALSGADANPFRQYHTSANDFRILTTSHSDSWLQQIATDFRTPYVYYRRKENGTWKDWTLLNDPVYTVTGLSTVAGNASADYYLSVRWYNSGVNGITTPYDGMKLMIKVPLAGVGTAGAMLSINGNNADDYHPLAYNINTVLTTHYAVNSYKIFTYDANATMDCYKTSNTKTTVTGVWKGESNYDSGNTKNSAGSTNSTSKLFFVGAASQASSATTYSNANIYTENGTLYLVKTQDASGTANNKPALIVGGADTSTHIEIDCNEVMAKATGTTTADLYLNSDGGKVYLGSGGTIYANAGSFYATNVYASSDRRLKENIKSAEIDYSKVINKLQIKEFNFKDDEDKKVVVGAIAQELKEILPEKYQTGLVSGSEEEYYSINEGKLLYIAIGALKDEMQKTQDLERRLEKVEKLLEK